MAGSILAAHGDAEWVKLIGLAIFAAISLVSGLIKKAVESRKSSEAQKKAAMTPPRGGETVKRLAKLPSKHSVRGAKPLRKADRPPPPLPISNKPAAPATARRQSVEGQAQAPSGEPVRVRWRLRRDASSLRGAIILSEILAPPLALRDTERY